MINKDLPLLQEVEWHAVSDEVRKCNKELADIIDEINPDKRYKLVKATYQYGDLIVKNGITYLPTANGLLRECIKISQS